MSMVLIYAFLSGLLPSFIWLWFWLREDALHPEPRSLMIGCFLGGFLAVIASIFAEQYIATLYTDPKIRYTLWAIIEELFKFIAVAVIALKASANDEPIDAMLYCTITALGFAALENTFYIMNFLRDGDILKAIGNGNMRFIGASLLHIVSSASVGFALGYVFYKRKIAKIIATVVGLTIAIIIHSSFNLSLINSTSNLDTLRTFGWLWAGVIVLIILFEEVKVVKPKLW